MNYEIKNGILTVGDFKKCIHCDDRGRTLERDYMGKMAERICSHCYGATQVLDMKYLLAPTSGPSNLPSKIPFDFDA